MTPGNLTIVNLLQEGLVEGCEYRWRVLAENVAGYPLHHTPYTQHITPHTRIALTRNPEPETRNPKSGTQNPQPETRNPDPGS